MPMMIMIEAAQAKHIVTPCPLAMMSSIRYLSITYFFTTFGNLRPACRPDRALELSISNNNAPPVVVDPINFHKPPLLFENLWHNLTLVNRSYAAKYTIRPSACCLLLLRLDLAKQPENCKHDIMRRISGMKKHGRSCKFFQE